MNNYLLLSKTFFLSGLNVNKKKKNQSTSFKTLALFGLLFLGLSFMYNFSFFIQLNETGVSLEQYMLLVLTIDATLVFVTTVFQMQRSIFKTKDYELLESLPIKKSTIVAAKFTSVYLIGLFEDFIVAIPAIIFNIAFGGSIYVSVLAFISLFFVAIIPLLFSSIIGSLVAILTARMKRQNLFSIIFYLLFLVGTMILSTSISTGNGASTVGSFTNLLVYFKLLEWSFDPTKWYFFIAFIGLHVVSFVAIIAFMGKIYHPLNAFLGNYKIHEAYVVGKNTKSVEVDKMLMKKEIKMVTCNANIIMNTFAGYIGYLFVAIMFLFMPSMFNDVEMTPEELADTTYIMTIMIPAFGLIMNSISSSSTISLSLEGKTNLELLNSYPLTVKQILKAKLKVALSFALISSIIVATIVTIISAIIGTFNLGVTLQLFILPTLASLLVSIVGMLCNLRWPKLEYENEMQVVKNSASVNLTMLFVALPSLFLCGGVIFLNVILGSFGGLLVVIPYLIAIIIAAIVLKNKGEMLFFRMLER